MVNHLDLDRAIRRLDSAERDAQHMHAAIENRLLAIEQSLDILASQLGLNGHTNTKSIASWQGCCLDALMDLCFPRLLWKNPQFCRVKIKQQ
jgi:hypothetical protein